jgi:cardiolipin synthase
MERLWITDAYLVAPRRLLQTLRDAARDGVDVRLLVPGTSDVPLVRNLSRIGYRDLLRSGARIYEWEGPMLHAKTIVADGRWSRIGSSNLNASSLIGNWELDVLIENRGLAEAMEHQFRLDIARSREVTRRPVRAPGRISGALPTALSRQDPELAPPAHHKSVRERRNRAMVAFRIVLANARRSIFLPLTGLLVVLGVFFFVLPTAAAYTFGALCAWLALSAWREAFRRRADR